MILRVAIHPKHRQVRRRELRRDRFGMDGGFCLLAHARWFRFGSLGLE
jgi:hypothetical protein